MFLCQVSANTCANWVDDDIRAAEVLFFEDVDVCLDLGVIRSGFSGQVIFDGIDEVTYVNYVRESWLTRHD